jgi:hypothetical protein
MGRLLRSYNADRGALALFIVATVAGCAFAPEGEAGAPHIFCILVAGAFAFALLDLGSCSEVGARPQSVSHFVRAAVVTLGAAAASYAWLVDADADAAAAADFLHTSSAHVAVLTLVCCSYALDAGYSLGGSAPRLSFFSAAHHALGLAGCAWTIWHRRLGGVLCLLLLDSLTAVIVCAEEMFQAHGMYAHARLFNRAYFCAFVGVRLVWYPLVLLRALAVSAPAAVWQFCRDAGLFSEPLASASVGGGGNAPLPVAGQSILETALLGRARLEPNTALFAMLCVWFAFSTVMHVRKFVRNGGFSQWHHV